jgi:ArsR family transcriptional regulator
VSKQEQWLDACCAPLDHEPLTSGQAEALSRGFKAVADPIRVRLLSLIASSAGGEACVCNLTGSFALTGPTISHHLKVLREAGLITGERRGTWVYYQAVPAAMRRLAAVLMPAEQPVS